mmetsp:Transcript_12873/g.23940  ORF Transcript_12873/g.23940 Transcript_12873/m.23940 type:complete len:113 (+) Transcript_12873:415-753(+)|eukprot:CAMPEP_0204898082 /NCGR_PEP_ID=MMETSP1397-20131031/1089_1 /ASSEMBLY_ACC=CAM_ASM_000891 /TAXON_ID=49980 /ORGANISM="Climacostomum Climacostomum virens, Strain Stock W-24" /LENGTH=112 /DNA_ID=CAMNT_0052065885 /DNA_START=188 /DNA_END=526 /DNA_ORIENTATION=+
MRREGKVGGRPVKGTYRRNFERFHEANSGHHELIDHALLSAPLNFTSYREAHRQFFAGSELKLGDSNFTLKKVTDSMKAHANSRVLNGGRDCPTKEKRRQHFRKDIYEAIVA